MKYILVLLVIIGIANAQELILNQSNQVNKQRQAEQRRLSTSRDYDDYINTMKKAISLGDYSAGIYLGALFSQDINLKDGVKKANLTLAKKYFRFSFNKGYGLAAFYLSKLENPNQAILDIKKALYMKYTTKKIRELLAIRYAEIILNDDELYKNKRAVKMAIADIEPISANSDNPLLDFQLAHLFYVDNQLQKANKYINSACNNKKATLQLLALCLNDPYLATRGKDGKEIVKKTLPRLSDEMYNNSNIGIKNRSK